MHQRAFKIYNPDQEAVNIKPLYQTEIKKHAQRVNDMVDKVTGFEYQSLSSKETIDRKRRLERKGNLHFTKVGTSTLEEHLGINAGEGIHLEQLEKTREEYDNAYEKYKEDMHSVVELKKLFKESHYSGAYRKKYPEWYGWAEIDKLEEELQSFRKYWWYEEARPQRPLERLRKRGRGWKHSIKYDLDKAFKDYDKVLEKYETTKEKFDEKKEKYKA